MNHSVGHPDLLPLGVVGQSARSILSVLLEMDDSPRPLVDEPMRRGVGGHFNI